MVPCVQQHALRPDDRDGRLPRDHTRRLERRREHFVAPAGHDSRDEAHARRLVCAELARGICKLVYETMVPCNFGQARERADVCGEPDVYFLLQMAIDNGKERESQCYQYS